MGRPRVLRPQLRRDSLGCTPLVWSRLTKATVFVLVAAALASPASGQVPTPDSANVRPLFGARVGPPFRAGAYLGIVANRAPGPHGDYDGRTIGIEAGIGGGQLTFGRAAGSLFGGVRYHVALLHTWGDSQNVAPGQTYIGAEFRLMIVAVGVGVGAYGRIAGNEPGQAGLVTLNAFFGL